MKCVLWKHGETEPGATTPTFERATTTLVVKGFPARVCSHCGEAYVESAEAARVLQVFEDAVRTGLQVGVRRYVAA